jgi:hypothetical protein
MKKFLFACFLVAGLSAFAVSVVDVTVSPRWPWQDKVDIDFTLDSSTWGFYAVTATLYDGETPLDVAPESLPDNGKIYAPGRRHMVFDYAVSGLATRPQALRAVFSVSSAPVRYMILDLMKSAGEEGAVEYICDGDPRLETFVKTIDYTDGATPAQTTIHYDNAFLAVTNKTLGSGASSASPYAINKMVFRLVKPGDYRVGKGSVSSSYNAVTLTKPYFISVSLLTRGQYGCIRYGDYAQTDSGKTTSYSDQSKGQSLYINDLRGPHDDAQYPVDWNLYGHYVCPTSFIGKARAKYGFAFDQPTETQWEVAARAGTTGYYYVDDDLTAANADLLDKIGYAGGNSSPGFGAKLANGWGLFDLLGRGQGVLDNGKQGSQPNDLKWPSGTDPVGEYPTWYGRTFSKGGGHASSSPVACGDRASTNASSVSTDWTSPYYNCVRLVINID